MKIKNIKLGALISHFSLMNKKGYKGRGPSLLEN